MHFRCTRVLEYKCLHMIMLAFSFFSICFYNRSNYRRGLVSSPRPRSTATPFCNSKSANMDRGPSSSALTNRYRTECACYPPIGTPTPDTTKAISADLDNCRHFVNITNNDTIENKLPPRPQQSLNTIIIVYQ